MCGCYDRFGGEAEFLEQQAPSRAGSIVVDADDPAASPTRSRQPMPTPASIETRARDHGVTPQLILLVEPLPTGH